MTSKRGTIRITWVVAPLSAKMLVSGWSQGFLTRASTLILNVILKLEIHLLEVKDYS